MSSDLMSHHRNAFNGLRYRRAPPARVRISVPFGSRTILVSSRRLIGGAALPGWTLAYHRHRMSDGVLAHFTINQALSLLVDRRTRPISTGFYMHPLVIQNEAFVLFLAWHDTDGMPGTD